MFYLCNICNKPMIMKYNYGTWYWECPDHKDAPNLTYSTSSQSLSDYKNSTYSASSQSLSEYENSTNRTKVR